MVRRWSAVLAMFALLVGFATAPYAHVHDGISSAADEHHPHGATLVHSHLSPHSRQHDEESSNIPLDDAPQPDRILPVATFVAHQPAVAQPDAPLFIAFQPPAAPIEIKALRIDPDRPRAHAPPIVRFSSLRAPPVLLPLSI